MILAFSYSKCSNNLKGLPFAIVDQDGMSKSECHGVCCECGEHSNLHRICIQLDGGVTERRRAQTCPEPVTRTTTDVKTCHTTRRGSKTTQFVPMFQFATPNHTLAPFPHLPYKLPPYTAIGLSTKKTNNMDSYRTTTSMPHSAVSLVESTGGISGKDETVPHNNTNGNCWTRLPDVILYKIFGDGYLTACDVVQCSKLNTTMAAWFDDSLSSSSLSSSATVTSAATSTTGNDENENHQDTKYDRVRHEKRLLWKKLLDQEGLPGETFQDLASHIHTWNKYRDELRKNLVDIAGVVASTTTTTSPQEEQRQLCHDFLTRAIPAYTWWVCKSHSWYKHLPTRGNAARFGFKCDLRANKRRMMRTDNTDSTDDDTAPLCHYVDFEKGDGTEFHYTWMPTKQYQQLFGNFCYYQIDDKETPVERFLSPAGYCNGSLVPIPRSSLVYGVVCVTATIHDRSPRMCKFSNLLRFAIERGCAELLTGGGEVALQEEWARGAGRTILGGGMLPVEAAEDLKAIAEVYIANRGLSHDRFQEQVTLLWKQRFEKFLLENFNSDTLAAKATSINEYENGIRGWSEIACKAQRYRERVAIGRALHEVCVQAYGVEWVPALDQVEHQSATWSHQDHCSLKNKTR
jgi:hypothetical protein